MMAMKMKKIATLMAVESDWGFMDSSKVDSLCARVQPHGTQRGHDPQP